MSRKPTDDHGHFELMLFEENYDVSYDSFLKSMDHKTYSKSYDIFSPNRRRF